MDKQLKSNISSSASWIRLLFMIFFAVCLQIASLVMGAVVVIQFLFVLIGGERNEQLRRFGACLSEYFFSALTYLTYNSEQKPFPFAEWPSAQQDDDVRSDVDAQADEVSTEKSRSSHVNTPRESIVVDQSHDKTEAHDDNTPSVAIQEPIDTESVADVTDGVEDITAKDSPQETGAKPRRKRTRKSDSKKEVTQKDQTIASDTDESEKN